MKPTTIALTAVTLIFLMGCEAPTSPLSTSATDGPVDGITAVAKNGNNGNSHATATGSVSWRTGQYIRTASFSVHDGAPGLQSDRGQIEYRFDPGSFHLAVDCADITGNVAVFGGTVTRGDGNFEGWVGSTVAFRVEDGGTPGRNGDTFVAYGKGSYCDSIDGRTPNNVISGNLVVH